MLLSWGLILGLNLFCFVLLFSRGDEAGEPLGRGGTVGEDEEEEIT